MLRRILFCLLFFFLLTFFSTVSAADYSTDYQVEYYLDKTPNEGNSNVKFNIAITNLNNEVYVKKFSIVFPRTFSIRNVKALDDSGEIIPQLDSDESNTRISLEFTNPKTGKDTINHFYLNFWQDNLFKDNGKSWELIIPTIENRTDTSYKVIVYIPPGRDKQISIAKPQPTTVTTTQVTWDNPATKTIYAVFGNSQYYKVDLNYHLKNPRLYPIITELALPPDTANQRLLVEKIVPSPLSVYLDKDGNYLARYKLAANSTLAVTFNGYLELTNDKRTGFVSLDDPKASYLLAKNKYWSLPESNKFDSLNSVAEIYRYVTNTLKYDYNKKLDSGERLGAAKALLYPDRAVCVEFTDLFIALARKNSIPAREIEGYGFSQDTKLRPLSLASDILHSWPEYFDFQQNRWIAVDPTWENTSGIDYFSSFDLNHLTFVVHGKQPDYPLPAGLYKIENSRDISVKPVSEIPVEKKNIKIAEFDFPKEIISGRRYQINLTVTNNSNIYLYDTLFQINSQDLKIFYDESSLKVLAPMESREITISYESKQSKLKRNSHLSVILSNKVVAEKQFTISPFYYAYALKSASLIFVITSGFGVLIMIRKLTKKK